MKNTMKAIKSAIKRGETLESIADKLIKVYKEPKEDLPIVKILSELGISVYVSNIDMLPRSTENMSIPCNLKCYVLKEAEFRRKHKSEFTIVVDTSLTLSEQRFWLAYCLGCVLLDRCSDVIYWVPVAEHVNKEDECYKFAAELMLSFV